MCRSSLLPGYFVCVVSKYDLQASIGYPRQFRFRKCGSGGRKSDEKGIEDLLLTWRDNQGGSQISHPQLFQIRAVGLGGGRVVG